MSDTNTIASGLNMSQSSSISWSPEHIPKPLARSMRTSPNRTGMMPMWARALMASVSVAMSFPLSMTKQEPGATETAGMLAALSWLTTIWLRSRTSYWTWAMAGTWLKSMSPSLM